VSAAVASVGRETHERPPHLGQHLASIAEARKGLKISMKFYPKSKPGREKGRKRGKKAK
jgi:hypothetical protein